MIGLPATVRVFVAVDPADLRKGDRDGFAVWMKRLERGTFRWPAPDARHLEWTAAELAAVLGGIDLKDTRRRPRFSLHAS